MEFIKVNDLNRKENYHKKFFTGVPIIMEEHTLPKSKHHEIELEDGTKQMITKEVVAVQQSLDTVIHLYRHKKSYRLSILSTGDKVPPLQDMKLLSFKKLNKKIRKLSKSLNVDSIIFF